MELPNVRVYRGPKLITVAVARFGKDFATVTFLRWIYSQAPLLIAVGVVHLEELMFVRI